MEAPPSERTGILILHLWIDAGASEGFRARITQKLDSRDREQTTSAAADPEGVYTAVRTWVAGFLEAGADDSLGRPPGDVSVTERRDGVTDISEFRRN
jgi:hypothetical protein